MTRVWTPVPIGIPTQEFGEQFARDWVDAWNSHDLERVLSYYDDAFEMASPRIALVTSEPSGILRGKDAVRPYWRSMLKRSPLLYFKLESVRAVANYVIVNFRSPRGSSSEVFFFSPEGRVVRESASLVGST